MKFAGVDLVRTNDSKSAFESGAGGLSTNAVICDFGTPGKAAQTFDFANASAFTTSKVFAFVPWDQPVASDELEDDPLAVYATVPVNGTVRIALISIQGSIIKGQRRVVYSLI